MRWSKTTNGAHVEAVDPDAGYWPAGLRNSPTGGPGEKS
jgi:hypothetical protein